MILIPKRLLLEAVVIQAPLVIYEEGRDSYYGAWIKMSAPTIQGETHPRIYTLCGNPARTKQAAKEKAAQSALHQLCTHHGIVINDQNHDALRTIIRSYSAAQDWS